MPNNYTNKYAHTGKYVTIRAYKKGEPIYQAVDRWRLRLIDLSRFYEYQGFKRES